MGRRDRGRYRCGHSGGHVGRVFSTCSRRFRSSAIAGREGSASGLTLAKRLAELHGGTIEAKKLTGRAAGARSPLRMPLAASTTDSALDDLWISVEAAREVSVIIAEDNPDAAEMMRVMLSIKGHDVRVATDGVQAVWLSPNSSIRTSGSSISVCR